MLDDELKALHNNEFVKGQESVAKEAAYSRYEDQQKLTQRAAKVAAETIDVVEQLAADGTPHKKQLADLIKNVVVGGVADLAMGRFEAAEGGEPNEANPFSLRPSGSEPRLSASSNPTKALPNEASQETPTPKRKRGRPPKNPRS